MVVLAQPCSPVDHSLGGGIHQPSADDTRALAARVEHRARPSTRHDDMVLDDRDGGRRGFPESEGAHLRDRRVLRDGKHLCPWIFSGGVVADDRTAAFRDQRFDRSIGALTFQRRQAVIEIVPSVHGWNHDTQRGRRRVRHHRGPLMTSLLKPAAARGVRLLRDGWLIFGITLVFIVLLDSGYRVVTAIGRAISGPPAGPRAPAPANPLDTLAWWPAYNTDHLREEEVQWTPYVYIRNPTFAGTHMTVDSLGHRVTPQSAVNGAPVLRVFFLGGSTTFGWFQRDSFTIPAVAARRLQDAVGDRASVRVTNFGVPGHTFTQEILELMLQLRAGVRPDVVVFYDGINDAMATVQNGHAGVPQNEWNRVADFERGRQLAREAEPGLLNDVRVSLRSARSMVGRLRFVRRLATRPSNSSGTPSGQPIDSLARHLVGTFASNAMIVEALQARFGFEPIYV